MPSAAQARSSTPKPAVSAPPDPALEAICDSFEAHYAVLVDRPFERRGALFVRTVGAEALAALYQVRFARRSPEPHKGPAVELVFQGTQRVPHARVQQLQRLIGARKAGAEDPLRGLRPYFGDGEARLTVAVDLTIDDPDASAMDAIQRLSSFIELIDPLVVRLTP